MSKGKKIYHPSRSRRIHKDVACTSNKCTSVVPAIDRLRNMLRIRRSVHRRNQPQETRKRFIKRYIDHSGQAPRSLTRDPPNHDREGDAQNLDASQSPGVGRSPTALHPHLFTTGAIHGDAPHCSDADPHSDSGPTADAEKSLIRDQTPDHLCLCKCRRARRWRFQRRRRSGVCRAPSAKPVTERPQRR